VTQGKKDPRHVAERSSQPGGSDLPQHIVAALRKSYPDGLIEMPILDEDNPFWEICDKLKHSLSSLKGATLIYERKPQWEQHWEEPDPDEDPPDWEENSRSYHLFFLSPNGRRFTYETEDELLGPEDDFDEEEAEADEFGEEAEPSTARTVKGHGRIGLAVAVSVVAPFALITRDRMENFEDGSETEPNLRPSVFTEEGEAVDPITYILELAGKDVLPGLQDLSTRIGGILEGHGISILAPEEGQKLVPWLRGSAEVFVGVEGQPITVHEAFFFEGM
jgi:hypothetical protein